MIAQVRIVSASSFSYAVVSIAAISISANALISIVDWRTEGIDMAIIGDFTRLSGDYALGNAVAAIPNITVTIIQ